MSLTSAHKDSSDEVSGNINGKWYFDTNNEMCQHLKGLYNSQNKYFQDDQDILAQNHDGHQDPF